MKKIICFVLCITMLVGSLPIFTFAAGAEENGIMPCYNNVALTDSLFAIDSGGMAYISVSYDGHHEITTGAIITVELQKSFLGMFWKTVEIGLPDNMWVDYADGYIYSNTHMCQLTSKGTYRAEIHYTIYGTAGPADEIEDFLTYMY